MKKPTGRRLPPVQLVSLPAELLDIIISYLAGDKLVLVACARVSSWLLPHARRHLYNTLDILKIVTKCYESSKVPLSFPTSTSIAIALRNPETAAYVKSLVLPQRPVSHWYPLIAPNLINVTSLHLSDLQLDPMRDGEKETLFAYFQNVQTLVLSSPQTHWQSFSVLRKFVLSFPKLTDLSYTVGSIVSRHALRRLDINTSPPNLDRLTMGYQQIPQLLGAFPQIGVRTLNLVDRVGPVCVNDFDALFSTLGSSLEELFVVGLRGIGTDMANALWPSQPLLTSSNTSLRIITIKMSRTWPAGSLHDIQWTLRLLHALACPSVQSISLIRWPTVFKDYQALAPKALEELDAALVAFTGLSQFILLSDGRYVKLRLPRVSAKKVKTLSSVWEE